MHHPPGSQFPEACVDGTGEEPSVLAPEEEVVGFSVAIIEDVAQQAQVATALVSRKDSYNFV